MADRFDDKLDLALELTGREWPDREIVNRTVEADTQGLFDTYMELVREYDATAMAWYGAALAVDMARDNLLAALTTRSPIA